MNLPLPDIWAGQQLFDFSGVDGETDFENPATATTMPDRAGFIFHTRVLGDPIRETKSLSVAVEVNGKLYDAPVPSRRQIVCSDLIDIALVEDDDLTLRVCFIYWKRGSIIGRVKVEGAGEDCEIKAYVLMASDSAVQVDCGDDEVAITSAKETASVRGSFVGTAMLESYEEFCGKSNAVQDRLPEPGHVLAATELALDSIDEGKGDFSFRIMPAAGETTGSMPDFDAEYAKKLAYFEALPVPSIDDIDRLRTYSKACSTLKVNVYSPQGLQRFHWTTPDRWPHRYMWLWDSAFQAFGYKHISQKLGEECLLAVLSMQGPDGYIPLATNHDMLHMRENHVAAYAGVRLTQPPTLAWAAWDVYKHGGNKEFLAYCLPRLTGFMRWLFANRDQNGNGLLEWQTFNLEKCPCGESGMDNSSRFRGGLRLDAIDLNAFVANEIRHMEMMSAELGMPLDDDISHRGRTLVRLINEKMWDDEDGFYYDLTMDGEFRRIKTISSFFPLLAKAASPRQAERLVEHLTDTEEFWADFPVRTMAKSEPTFDRNMWRGPVWVNCNYIVMNGLREYGYNELADRIAEKTMEQITKWYLRDGSIYELYHDEDESPMTMPRKEAEGSPPELTQPLRDYGWTCAIFVDLLLQGNRVQGASE